jgi:hypothetical protein
MENIDVNRIQYILIVGSILFLLFIIELIRKKKIKEQYSLLWLVLGIAFIFFSVWRKGLDYLASFVGIDYPPSALFIMLLIGVFFILIQYSIIISKLSNQNIILAQEISLIKLELEKIKEFNKS